MSLQSKALEVPHLKIKVKKPYRKEYREAISRLVKTKGIEGIVTVDMYVLDDAHGRWIENVCEGLDIDVIMPLWGQTSRQVLD